MLLKLSPLTVLQVLLNNVSSIGQNRKSISKCQDSSNIKIFQIKLEVNTMKKNLLNLFLAFSLLFSISLEAEITNDNQRALVEKLLSVRNISISDFSDICTSDFALIESANEE